MTPDDCLHCVNSTRGTCLLGKDVSTAWVCKTMGWHETAAQVRARSIREQEEHIRGLLREAQSQYTADQVARKALMTGVR